VRGPTGAVSAALGFRGFAPILGVKVKERLTGAIILVALIVLLVPELLTGPLRSAPRVAAMAPPAGEPPLRSYTINLADERQARSAATPASGPQQPAPLGSGTPQESASAQVLGSAAPAPQTPAADSAAEAPSGAGAATPPAPPAQPPPAAPAASAPASAAPAPAPAATLSGAAWVVQLGSFASRANAEHLAQQVRSQGFQVSVSQGSSGRRLYRVRVGGARDRSAAAQLAQKLRALGHSGGTVVPK
jgi:DedD protein